MSLYSLMKIHLYTIQNINVSLQIQDNKAEQQSANPFDNAVVSIWYLNIDIRSLDKN